MVPTRTLAIVVDRQSEAETGRARIKRRIIELLAAPLDARRRVPSAEDAAQVRRFDRAMDLIEHETCDCV